MFQDPDEQIMASSVLAELALGRAHAPSRADLQPFGLAERSDLDPRLLSAGQKQRLVLAVSLAGNPRVLFCDEPTALQDDQQAAWVLDFLGQWRQQNGATLVTATCDRREAARADDLLVLDQGRVAACGPRQELWDHPLVSELLGQESGPVQVPAWETEKNSAAKALEVRELEFRLGNLGTAPISLAMLPGMRLGVTGPNGCGKSTLLAALVGARQPDGGCIILGDYALYQGSGLDLDHGLALLAPQFPEYMFTRSTVAAEIELDPGLPMADPSAFLDRLGLSPDLAARNPHSLSSGQKRRLALGLVLFSGRRILLLDEPTAALDFRGRALVKDLIGKIPPETTLVVASHDRKFLTEFGCHCLEMAPLAPISGSDQ